MVFIACVGSQIGLIIVDTFSTATIQFMIMNRSGKSWDEEGEMAVWCIQSFMQDKIIASHVTHVLVDHGC